MEQAQHVYVESLEAEMDATIKSRPVATQVLQIFRLKAEAPEKYREEVKVVGIDQSKMMLDQLREMASRDIKALEGGSVEGEYKEIASPKPDMDGLGQTPPPRTEAPPVQPPRESASRVAAKESARDRRAAQVKAGRVTWRQPPGRMVRR